MRHALLLLMAIAMSMFSARATTISGTATVCVGSTTTLTGSPGGGTWSSDNISVATVGSSGVVTGVNAGTATISYTVPGNDPQFQVVTVNPLPAAITGIIGLNSSTFATLADTTAGGTWSSSNTTVASIGSTTGKYTGGTSGTARITYKLSTGCSSFVTVTVVTSTITFPILCTKMIGTATTTAAAGGIWHTSGHFSSIDSNTGVITATTADTSGIDTLTYTIGTIVISNYAFPVHKGNKPITGPSLLCVGSIGLMADATGSGTWSSSDTTIVGISGATTGMVTGVDTGSATITFTTGSLHCWVTYPVTVVRTRTGTMSGTPNMYVCKNARDTFTVSVSTGGLWSSPNSFVGTVDSITGIFLGIHEGIETLQYIDSLGCILDTVSVEPIPGAITGPPICVGTTVTWTDNIPGGTWTSSSSHIILGLTTGMITGVDSGGARIFYTSPKGCLRATDVTVNPSPAAITGTLQVCKGQTTTLSDASTGGKWRTSNSAIASVDSITGVVTGVSAGSATISYTFTSGCFKSVTFTVNPLPSAITGTLSLCLGQTTTLTDSITGGKWHSSSPTVATIDSITGLVTALTAGTTTVSYTLATGCGTATAIVTVNPIPAAITGTLVVCAGSTTTLADTVGGGTWTSGSPLVATVASGVVTGVNPGTANITYMLPGGCYVTATVTVNPLPAAISGTLQVCVGQTTTLTDDSTGGSWSSSNSDIASVDPATGVVTGNHAGSATITYTLPAGCYMTATVTVNPLPAAISGTLQVCVGQTTTLTDDSTGGTWGSSNSEIASVDPTTGVVTGGSAGTATITYTLPAGCLVTATVTVNPAPSSISGTLALACIGTTTLTATPSGGTWSTGNATVATVNASTGVVTAAAPGTATISYTLAGGCYSTAIVTVSAPVITGTDTICAGSSATLSCTPSGGSWSSSAPAVIAIGSSTGIYTGIAVGSATITYSQSAGCYSVKTVTAKNCPIGICETYPISTCDTVISYCDSLTLSVSNASSADTFTWSPTIHPVQSLSGGAVIFTFTAVPTSGVYTLTVASPGGFHRSATIRIVVAPGSCYPCSAFKPSCACPGCGVVAFKTIISTTLNSSNISTSTPGNYFIVNDATISGAPAAGSVFYMAKGVRLTVDSTDSVVLSGCHFFSPSCYWKGITVSFKSTSTGKVTVDNNTLIEDAIGNALDSNIGGINGYSGTAPHLPASGGYIIKSNNAIFNHNVTGIRLQEDSSMTTLPFQITGTIFTNRNFCGYHIASPSAATDYYPFKWPSADYLKTPVSGGNPDNPDFKVDTFTANSINDSIGRFGIRTTYVGKTSGSSVPYTYYTMIIGDSTDSARTNLFDTLGTGIYGFWSNLEIYNNIFRRTPVLTGALGNGIVLNTCYTNKVKIAAGSAAHTNNNFYNCYYGVNADANGARYFECTDAVMKFTYTSVATVTPTAIDIVQVAPLEKHYISRNTISNAQIGISDGLNRTSCSEGDIIITHNNITGFLPASSSAIEGSHYGIAINEPSPADCSSSTGTLRIDSNSISGFATGIGITCTSFKATGRQGVLNTNIDANTIVLKTNSTVLRTGINVFAMKYVASINKNLVYGDTTQGVKFNTPSTGFADGQLNGYSGIFLMKVRNGSGNTDVSCNFVHDMNIGFKFWGDNNVTWTKNMMMRNKYGLLMNELTFGIVYNGQIGTQGATCSPADNIWYDDGTATAGWPGWLGSAVRQTYMVGSDAAGSTLYVRSNPTDTAYRYNPTNNGGMNAGAITFTAYSSSTIINAATGCGSALSAPDSTCALSSGDSKPAGDQSTNNGLTDIQNTYTLYPNPGDGNIKIAQSIAENTVINVKVMNSAGALVYQGSIEFKNGIAGLKIDVVPGVYFVVLTDSTGKLNTFRTVIQK